MPLTFFFLLAESGNAKLFTLIGLMPGTAESFQTDLFRACIIRIYDIMWKSTYRCPKGSYSKPLQNKRFQAVS